MSEIGTSPPAPRPGVARRPRPAPSGPMRGRRGLGRLVALALALWPLAGCMGKVLNEQRVEIERQREELSRLTAEMEAGREQQRKEREQREACNRAFYEYQGARSAARTDEAIAHYEKGLSLCPDDDVAHNELGELYLGQGRIDAARAEFEEALRINPEFSRARQNLEAAAKKEAPRATGAP